ncbi:MAG: hypothetical protein QXZ09_09640 [Candidatus Methanomethylicaceae archaeon]
MVPMRNAGTATIPAGAAVKAVAQDGVFGAGVVQVNAANDLAVAGIAVDAIPAGKWGRVALRGGGGTVRVRTGASVAVNDRLATDTQGRFVANNTANTPVVVAVALEAAGAADSIVHAVLV